jgi:methionyl-tRNA formyltransferase
MNKIIFLGSTKFSEEILKFLILKKFNITHIFSSPEEFKISYSKKNIKNYNYTDLSRLAKKYAIKFIEISKENNEKLSDFKEIIKKVAPDIILVAGWYYMIPKSILSIPKHGVWGLHASLLPKYAGGAPLVWAMLNGEKETGITLFRMKEGVDNGDIIGQRKFKINNEDTIEKMIIKSIQASKRLLSQYLNKKELFYKNQNPNLIKIYPQRSPDDGEIDWDNDPEYIQRFIRAQTKPYPGAWTIIGNKKIIIWDAEIDFIDKKTK